MNRQQPYRLIISGGGTGGHIFPAVAIANEFRDRHPDAQILFVGAKNKMEINWDKTKELVFQTPNIRN